MSGGGAAPPAAKRSTSTPGGETTIRSSATPSRSSPRRARSVAATKTSAASRTARLSARPRKARNVSRNGIVSQIVTTSRNPCSAFSRAGWPLNQTPSSALWTMSASARTSPRPRYRSPTARVARSPIRPPGRRSRRARARTRGNETPSRSKRLLPVERDPDVVPVGQQLPDPELPRVRGVPAQHDDPRFHRSPPPANRPRKGPASAGSTSLGTAPVATARTR